MRQPLLVSLAALLAGTLLAWHPSAAFAALESDIPGIPLPGPVVTGRLGGPIYDVVYRVDVPARSVLVAGLVGTPGTDFDLYLFGSTATTVQSPEGLIAKSIGPTSSEQLSFATAVGGPLYLDLNGATNVEGTFTLTVQVVPDPTPPEASLRINGGAPATNDPHVELSIGGFEDLSGVVEMSFSSDGVTYGPWLQFATAHDWTLGGADGQQRLWVRVRNGVGVVSVAATDTIMLDRVAPAVTAVTPPRDQSVGEPRPTIRVTFDEPIRFESWFANGIVMQAPNGALVPGTYSYDSSARTGTFTPNVDLDLGLAYVVTVGAVTDLAGNPASPTGSWLLRRLVPTAVTMRSTTLVIPWGSPVRLAGTAVLPPDAALDLEERPANAASFQRVGSLRLEGGTFDVEVTPARTTWYRATYSGTSTVSAAASPPVRILVRRLIVLEGLAADATRTARPGSSVVLTARARPGRAGIAVSFRLYRIMATGRLEYRGSYGRRTDEAGRAVLRWVPNSGRWLWRVAVLADAEYTSNMSPGYRWTVR